MGLLYKLASRLEELARSAQSRREEEKRKRLILESGLFDAKFYIEQYPDLAGLNINGLDAVTHYIRYGGLEGRNPSADFDGDFYLRTNADVRDEKINPLVHYLTYGREEGRLIRACKTTPRAASPVAPQVDAWNSLAASLRKRKVGPTVDVVVPVYRGFDETMNCLYSVLCSCLTGPVACELVVINDASPEQPLSEELHCLSAAGLFTLVRSDENEGFAASVNRGIQLHPDRDVIVLNSDTEVYGDWIERLRSTAYSDVNVGTVTPFSNNASLCSYPIFAGEFHGALEVTFRELDNLARDVNAGLAVDVPTAVGFCMYIRRECLDEVGLFNSTTGLGYGEEPDFSRRIVARGWRNLLAGDVFVRHIGRVSFQDRAARLGRDAMRIMNKRHPDYQAEVSAYIENDPPKLLRRNLDLARIRRVTPARSFLLVSHGLGGGTGRHVRDLTERLSEEGIGVFTLTPRAGDGATGELSHSTIRNLSVAKEIDFKHGLSAAGELLRDLGVIHIHVHHLMRFAPETPQFITALAELCGLTYDFTVHDYTPVCPRMHMTDHTGSYCDNSDIDVCERCLVANGSPFGDVSAWFWRATYRHFLERARCVFVPDEDVKARLTSFLPDIPVTVRPHPELLPKSFAQPISKSPGSPLRVAIIGATSQQKGSRQLLQCAADAVRRGLLIKFVFIGYSDVRELRRLAAVETVGQYADSDLQLILAGSRCHVAFFPSVCPETYSYTLTQAFYAGLYPVAFDIGAVAARIRASGWGTILPMEMINAPSRVNDTLLALQPPQRPANWRPAPGAYLYRSILRDYYGLEFEGDVHSPAAARQQAKLGAFSDGDRVVEQS